MYGSNYCLHVDIATLHPSVTAEFNPKSDQRIRKSVCL